MELEEKILRVEMRLSEPLEKYFSMNYNEQALPSHGINHHRRVWKYIKEVLPYRFGIMGPEDMFLDQMIIACFFHDIGMSEHIGADHGKISRKMCENFLLENEMNINEYADALEAIENHDNKDYNTRERRCGLLDILSVADDLDAFGYTGIYRFIEIYLKRNTDPSELGNLILQNAEKRFINFALLFSNHHDFVEKHEIRYRILTDFFTSYNNEIRRHNPAGSSQPPHIRVIEIIAESAEKKIKIENLPAACKKYAKDRFVSKYFSGLEKELS